MPSVHEQFQKVRDLLEHLDGQIAKGPANRRRANRLPVRMPMTLTLMTGSTTAPVEIFSRNFSQSGFGFVSRRLFCSNERVALVLKFPNQTTKQILARVTFARYIRNGMYEMGTEFLECVSNPRNPDTFPGHWHYSGAE